MTGSLAIKDPLLTRRSLLAGGAAMLVSARSSFAAGGLAIETYVAPAGSMRVAAHLVLGRREAVLIDAAFLRSDASRLTDMIERSGCRLTHVLVSHAHPDHHFGAAVLRGRFPDARFVARPRAAAEIAATRAMANAAMTKDYPGLIDTTPVAFEPFTEGALRVDGLSLPLVDFAGGESHDQVAVLTPDRREVIASDLLYDRTHLYLGDRDVAAWKRNLDTLAALGTRRARPGHGSPGATAALIAGTRRYLDRFEAEAGSAVDADTLMLGMRRLYPGWAADRLLRYSADAHFPSR